MYTNKILIVKIFGVGNAILLSPSIKAYKELHSESVIDIVMENRCKGLWDNWNLINKIYYYDPRQIKSCIDELIHKQYDLLFLSPPVNHIFDSLIPIAKRHIVPSYEMPYQWEADINFNVVKRCGYASDIPTGYVDVSETDYKKKYGDYIIIHIGAIDEAGHENKMYPLDKFAKICDLINQTHHFPFVFIGTNKEFSMLSILRSLIKTKIEIIDLCNALTLPELASLTKTARLYIGNDSGPLHVASVMGCPVIGIYGPTPLEKSKPLHPYPERLLRIHRHNTVDCAPCYLQFSKMVSCQNRVCFDIEPEYISREAIKLLDKPLF